jgi:arginyl-tRNA--protein-N-Asp/Glu arginylyltransferase
MKSDVVRLFQTLPHPCGYYPDRTAQNLVIDPSASRIAEAYPIALSQGFRRAGGHVYHPRCPDCQACVPCRIPVQEFVPDRSQRRCEKRNADLEVRVSTARYTREYFDLYRRYLGVRHAGGGMDDPGPEDFERFLYTTWSPTSFLELRAGELLLGVAVTDVCTDGLSAVYTFFDPQWHSRSLGTWGILNQISLARRLGLPYVYLGYWIAGHPKMHYKANFRPLQVLRSGLWDRLQLSA